MKKVILSTLVLSLSSILYIQGMETQYKNAVNELRDRATIAYGSAQNALNEINEIKTEYVDKGDYEGAKGEIESLSAQFANFRIKEDADVIEDQLIAAAKDNKDMAAYIKERTGEDFANK